MMKAKEIKWDLSDVPNIDIDELKLPTEAELPSDIDEDEISDWLSDNYGFCVESFSIN